MDKLNWLTTVLVSGSLGTSLLLLFWKTLQLMARNYLALCGQALPNVGDTTPQETCFVFRVQNLESVPFDFRVCVRLSAILTREVFDDLASRLEVLAGVKALKVSAERKLNHAEWNILIDGLAPFDTLTFKCRVPAEKVSMEVFAEGQKANDLFQANLERALWPNGLVAYKTDVDEARFEGPTHVPVLMLPVVISVMAVCAHLFAVLIFTKSKTLETADICIVSVELVAIWISYLLIRRRSQPITTGYTKPTLFVRSTGAEGLPLKSLVTSSSVND